VSTFYKDDNDQELNIAKIDIHVPSQRTKVEESFDLQDEHEYPLVILHAVNYDKKKGGNTPFFITLVINDLLLHNCMLD
jgi:hypothetical protein